VCWTASSAGVSTSGCSTASNVAGAGAGTS
jgi:hypothetical protein